MSRDSSEVLLNLKKKTDELVGDDQEIQIFLKYIQEQSEMPDLSSQVSLRAFYYSYRLDRLINKSMTIRLQLVCALNDEISVINDHRILLILNLEKSLDISLELTSKNCALRTDSLCYDLQKSLALSRAYADQDPDVRLTLQALIEVLLGLQNLAEDDLEEWWSNNGDRWTEELRQFMIDSRNVGHDWRFTNEQKKLLQQYYDANLLLVQCLNSDCYVSRHVRESIENTLLLPMEELRMMNVEVR